MITKWTRKEAPSPFGHATSCIYFTTPNCGKQEGEAALGTTLPQLQGLRWDDQFLADPEIIAGEVIPFD